MVTLVLIHGAGSDSWYWHRVVPLLEAAGHDVVAVDLPCDDDAADLATYTEVVVDAIGSRRNVVLVAQSMAGFTAPLVCQRLPVAMMILVAAMVPAPGESGAQWWTNTGHEQARRAQAIADGRDPDADDPATLFLHDVPSEVTASGQAHVKEQSGTPFIEPWPLDAWPDTPTHFLLCRHDRFFPAPFLRRVVQQRLGFAPDEMDGGHLPALAHPDELTARLLTYAEEV